MRIQQESVKTHRAMKKALILFLFLCTASFCNLGSAGLTTPLATSSIFRTFDSNSSNYVHSALLVSLTPNETDTNLLDANLKCISYSTAWAGRTGAWDFNLTSAYEVNVMDTPWADLQEVLKHLPEIHTEFCPIPLHTSVPNSVDVAETLHRIVRRPFITPASIAVDGPLPLRVVLGSHDIFYARNLGSMATHIGGTVLLRPSLRPNEGHLRICSWDQTVFNARFPTTLDPTRYENRKICQILNRSIYDNIPFYPGANQLAIPANPF